MIAVIGTAKVVRLMSTPESRSVGIKTALRERSYLAGGTVAVPELNTVTPNYKTPKICNRLAAAHAHPFLYTTTFGGTLRRTGTLHGHASSSTKVSTPRKQIPERKRLVIPIALVWPRSGSAKSLLG